MWNAVCIFYFIFTINMCEYFLYKINYVEITYINKIYTMHT